MKFCENPKCLFHVDVARNRYLHNMVVSEPAEGLLGSLSRYAIITTREKHLWRNPKKGTEWFFCDVCHEAASMVKEND